MLPLGTNDAPAVAFSGNRLGPRWCWLWIDQLLQCTIHLSGKPALVCWRHCSIAQLLHPPLLSTPPPAASTALCCTSCTYMQSDIRHTAHHVSCLQSKRLFPAIPDAIRGQWLVAATSGTSTALLPPQALSLLQLHYLCYQGGRNLAAAPSLSAEHAHHA